MAKKIVPEPVPEDYITFVGANGKALRLSQLPAPNDDDKIVALYTVGRGMSSDDQGFDFMVEHVASMIAATREKYYALGKRDIIQSKLPKCEAIRLKLQEIQVLVARIEVDAQD